MTTATILTANIAYGFAGMDRLASSLSHQLHIHGWGALTYEVFPPLRGRTAKLSASKREAYVLKHRNLQPALEMIGRIQPDLLVLNEVIYEVYCGKLECALHRTGFQAISWGVSTHYPGTSISTLIATKDPGTPIPCTMPQRPSMGGGAGMAGLRLPGTSTTVFGVHLTYRSPALFKRQLEYIVQAVVDEYAHGNDVVIAGDWNVCASTIIANPSFKTLDLIPAASVEKVTCPTFLPRFFQKPLDHVFVPSHWQQLRAQTIAFGSDHLALAVEVQPPPTRLPRKSALQRENEKRHTADREGSG